MVREANWKDSYCETHEHCHVEKEFKGNQHADKE